MTPLDQLLLAQTPEEQKAALKAWKKAHGSVFEFLATMSQPGTVASLVSPERFAELLNAYQRSRRNYLAQIKRNMAAFAQDEFEYHMLLYSLAEHLEGDLESVRPIMEKMLLNRDTEIVGVATQLFDRMGTAAWASWPVIRKAFARHGVWEIPFHLGNAVVAAVREEPQRLESLRSALLEMQDKEQQALCQVLVELGTLAAPLTDTVFSIADSKTAAPDTINCAIMALGYLGVTNPRISTLIGSAIDSEHWFIRANAIGSAGLLHLDPDTFIPLIARHLDDHFGHDGWSAATAAVKALGQYGPAAHSSCDALEGMMKTTDDEDIRIAVSEALALIRQKSQA